jgi:hypothetical protein
LEPHDRSRVEDTVRYIHTETTPERPNDSVESFKA